MTRHVLKRVCAPSAIAAALIAVLWGMSYRTNVSAHSSASVGEARWDVSSARGLLTISVTHDSPVECKRSISALKEVADPAWARHFDAASWKDSYAGFSASQSMAWIENDAAQLVARPTTRLVLPFWMMFALAIAPSAYRFAIAFRAKWRAAQGMCPDCGYDMVGTDAGGDCRACTALTIAIEVAPEAARLATAI